MKYLEGISEVVEHFDAFLIDIWGVLHNGIAPYPGVLDCLERIKKEKRIVMLLSNSARRSNLIRNDLNNLGISPNLYDVLVSSGEFTWYSLATQNNPLLGELGSSYYLLGSERYGLTHELELNRTESINSADFILAIGIEGNPATTEQYENVLQDGHRRRLKMICANPDQKVMRGGLLGIGPGALAKRYEALGGSVIYFGKPHVAIYNYCFKMLGELSRKRSVAVGDSLDTDIKGAVDSSIKSILIKSGIYAPLFQSPGDHEKQLEQLCGRDSIYPSYVADKFTW